MGFTGFIKCVCKGTWLIIFDLKMKKKKSLICLIIYLLHQMNYKIINNLSYYCTSIILAHVSTLWLCWFSDMLIRHVNYLRWKNSNLNQLIHARRALCLVEWFLKGLCDGNTTYPNLTKKGCFRGWVYWIISQSYNIHKKKCSGLCF